MEKQMHKSLLRIIVLAGFLANELVGQAQPADFDPALAVRLQRTLDSLQAELGVRGLSAGVIRPGQGLWQGVSGFSHAGAPVTADMAFGIASNTKLFTAAAVMKLVEDGTVTLEDPLHRWLPPFRNIDSTITIRQLLNHVSGVADVNAISGYRDSIMTDPSRLFTAHEVLSWVGPPQFAPGTDWSYCNTNYILAGLIVERVSGRPFAEFLRARILAPLAFDSTFIDPQESAAGRIAHPWHNGLDISNVPRISLNSAAGAAGAMYSTSSEMAQWYEALMNGAVLGGAAFAEMTTFVGSGNYGFGITQKTIEGRTLWLHGGDIRGYRSQMLYDTATGAVVCVLSNANPAPVTEIALALLRVILSTPVTSTEELIVRNYATHQLGPLSPNPVRSAARLDYVLAHPAHVRITVHDLLGRSTVMLIDAFKPAGPHSVAVDVRKLKRGMYLYRMEAGKQLRSGRMLVE